MYESDGVVRVPSHFGLFAAELARQAGSMTLYLHEGDPNDTHDMILDDPRIEVVNMGPRRRAPAMTFWPGPSLREFHPLDAGLDVVVIRGPTALLPHLRRRSGEVPVVLQLGGDYSNWKPQKFFPWWRNALIRQWVRLYRVQQDAAARGTLVLAQSPVIGRHRSGSPYPGSVVWFISTLPEASVAHMADVSRSITNDMREPLRLLYTGRFVKDKGLFELVEAVGLLVRDGHSVELRLVGWSDEGDSTQTEILRLAQELGVSENIKVGGYRSAGDELVAEYRDADVFVSPTYYEGGVSCSVIEAMACGTPVVTTRIPAVEGLLHDEGNALLVPPESTTELAQAIERLLLDPSLRASLAREGSRWARGLTIEGAVATMCGHIRNWLEGQPSGRQ